MEKQQIYLFGAGANCAGVIKFFGKTSIKAIIDSDKRIQGSLFDGMPIISLQEYLNTNCGESIVISGFYAAQKIAKVLEENNIDNFYVCPYIQNGFYENGKDIIEKLNLCQYSSIYFCWNHPLARVIVEEMKKKDYRGNIYFADRDNCEEEKSILILTNFIEKKQNLQGNYKQIIDINEIYKTKYIYINQGLLKFKNIHKGKRCFIIGNGPSLTYKDLQKLYEEKEICFGVNRIYLSFEYTDWRPDYYTACDYFIIKKDAKIIEELCIEKFIRHQFREEFFEKKENIYEYGGLSAEQGDFPFSDDIVQGIYIGKTVVYDSIQIAAYMGFSEIYLLGVDLTANMIAEKEGMHFYKSPDTNERLPRGERDKNLKAMKNARIYMESQGRSLKNATRNVDWDVLEKVDFDCLFGEKTNEI
ncbi:MAG: DUF115 domain-containing protein [Hungatella sp.]|nr:DUF115 domain-containing protein [Hungatella sp.]